MKKIDWYRVLDILTIPLVFAVTYTITELGAILALANHWTDRRALIGAGWVLGLLTGVISWHACVARPRAKLIKALEALDQSTMELCKAYRCELEAARQAAKTPRVDGDEWKDG